MLNNCVITLPLGGTSSSKGVELLSIQSADWSTGPSPSFWYYRIIIIRLYYYLTDIKYDKNDEMRKMLHLSGYLIPSTVSWILANVSWQIKWTITNCVCERGRGKGRWGDVVLEIKWMSTSREGKWIRSNGGGEGLTMRPYSIRSFFSITRKEEFRVVVHLSA